MYVARGGGGEEEEGEEPITVATGIMGFPVLDNSNTGLVGSNGHILSFFCIVFVCR
jgi:hypothetical protein